MSGPRCDRILGDTIGVFFSLRRRPDRLLIYLTLAVHKTELTQIARG